MMKHLLVLPVLLLSLMLTFPVDVQACFQKFPTKMEELNKSDARLVWAKELDSMLTRMNEAVPTLKPSEKEWLETETTSKDYNRKFKAWQSSEYKIDDTKSTLRYLVSKTNLLVALLEEREVLGDKYDFKFEAQLWTQVAAGLGSIQLMKMISELHESKKIDISGIINALKNYNRYEAGEIIKQICLNTSTRIFTDIVLRYFYGALE